MEKVEKEGEVVVVVVAAVALEVEVKQKKPKFANFINKFNERINLIHKEKEPRKTCLHELVSYFSMPEKAVFYVHIEDEGYYLFFASHFSIL